MSKTVSLVCDFCPKIYERPLKEYNRAKRNGNKMFCSRSCACSYGLKINPRKGNASFLNAANRLDKFSPFRYFISKANSAQRRQWYGDSDLDLEYLSSVWESQNGICPYTGFQMELPNNTQDSQIKGKPKRASLDRINSEKGYVKGNVEFVCLAVNLAKNRFSRAEMMDFFKKN
jgi:hypothetical protein